MWFFIAVTLAVTLAFMSWAKERPNHQIDAKIGERILYKRRWASMYIDDECIWGTMTIEFRETYMRVYQTFSHRIIFRSKYDNVKRVNKTKPWLETYSIETMNGENAEIGFYRGDDAKALSYILKNVERGTLK